MDIKDFMNGVAIGAGLIIGCIVILEVIAAASKLFSWLMQLL